MNNRDFKITDLQLHKGTLKGYADPVYYLSLVAEYVDERGLYELRVPYIDLGIGDETRVIINRHLTNEHVINESPTLSMGYLYDIPLVQGNKRQDGCFTVRELEKFYKEMTLSEIEKKLGCNIKLISEAEG